jgi:hypothetical protein
MSPVNPFPPDALEANRRGELSEAQRRGFGALSRDRRRSGLSSAAFFTAGALLIAFFASPSASIVLRMLLTAAGLAIAAFLVVRSITGADALTRDLRRVQVQCAEGAIGKRRLGASGRVTTCFLDVGDQTFQVAPATYEAAPDAGRVRVYFLPRSRKVVNLERLPNAPLPDEVTPQGILKSLGAAIHSHNRREENEARAEIASLGDVVKASFAQSPAAPPPGARDPRPLDEAILGTWTNGLMKVTFSADGRVTTNMFGAARSGHWSVDPAGRLRADITGRLETADAWVAGNQLTVAAEGAGLTFTREAGG